jgi:hypothetical protein
MTNRGIGILTTGIVARLNRLPDSHAWRLRWSNAGHPPPVLVHGDGLISMLETPPDRPLGVGADRSRCETDAVLQPGTTLLLFTDGLVERRGQVIDDGIRSLLTTLTDRGHPRSVIPRPSARSCSIACSPTGPTMTSAFSSCT